MVQFRIAFIVQWKCENTGVYSGTYIKYGDRENRRSQIYCDESLGDREVLFKERGYW